MKNQLKLILKKRDELLSHFNENSEISFEELIEIVFELKIPPDYNKLPDGYPFELRKNYLRLNSAIVMIADLVKQHQDITHLITKKQNETTKEDGNLSELFNKQNELIETINPLISNMLELINEIKSKK